MAVVTAIWPILGIVAKRDNKPDLLLGVYPRKRAREALLRAKMKWGVVDGITDVYACRAMSNRNGTIVYSKGDPIDFGDR